MTFNCSLCGMAFSDRSNMYRHRKHICMHKQYNKEDINIKYNVALKEIEHLKETIEHLKETIDELKPFKIGYMNVMEKSFETTNKVMEINSETTKINAESTIKSLSTARYISKHLTQAQPLKYEKKEIAGLLEYNNSKKYKPVDYVIYNYTLKKLPEWIGNIIIKVYKKENPFDQNIWVTDNSRFSYVIFDVIEDASGKKSEWITDKSGTKITEKIIAPTLELLQEMLELYLEETRDIYLQYDNMEMEEISRYSNNKQKTFDIVKEIKDEFLHKDVLKFITPFFSTDPIKLEDAITKTLNDKESDNEIVSKHNSTKVIKKKIDK
jgi:hypothetical protein